MIALALLGLGAASALAVSIAHAREAAGSRGDGCLRSGGRCLYPYRLQGSDCLPRLLKSGSLGLLLSSRGVCGAMLLYREAEQLKALRRLEAQIMTYRIELERNPDNLRARYRLELLNALYKDLASLGNPVSATLVLLFCESKPPPEVVHLASMSGCSLVPGLPGRPFPLLAPSPPLPLGRLSEALAGALSLHAMIGLLSESDGVVIGVEKHSGAPVTLPLSSRELGGLHTLVVGPTGRGKTTLLARLVVSTLVLHEDYCVTIVDPKGDLESMVSPLLAAGGADFKAALRLSLFGRSRLASEGPEAARSAIEALRASCTRSLVVVDEAWRLYEPLGLASLIREARSTYTSLVAATQQPDDMPSSIVNNVHSVIAFGSEDADYARLVARMTGSDTRLLGSLSVGEALFHYFESSGALVVKVRPPPIRVKKSGGWGLTPPGRAPWVSGW